VGAADAMPLLALCGACATSNNTSPRFRSLLRVSTGITKIRVAHLGATARSTVGSLPSSVTFMSSKPVSSKPRFAKCHSQHLADEYVRIGWTLVSEFRDKPDEEPYEYVLAWKKDDEPMLPSMIAVLNSSK
jgi:hypothetical protein